MASYDQVHRLAVLASIPTTAIAGNVTTNGAVVDTLGYEAVTLMAMVLTRTDGTYTFKVQTATDLAFTTPVDLAATQVIGGVNAVALAVVGIVLLGVLDSFRFLRAVDTSTAVTTGGSILANFILGRPRHSGAPV